ncbi:Putative LOC100202460, partial [Caligus rogercresseyi]
MTKGTKAGLSRETFLAAQHTANVLQELANYLLTEKGFQYALLGKINSDPLEQRFGWYRQLAGANYFISVRQFLEAERKIRFKSLVNVNKLTMTEVTDIFREPEGHKAKINEEGDKLLACLSSDNLCSESDVQLSGEEGVVYYIGGYIARSLLKRTKCKSCSSLLAKNRSPPNLELLEDYEEGSSKKEEFCQLLNRGGLVTPSDHVYLTCMHVLQLKAELFDDDYTQELFLASSFPRAVFVNILTKKILNTSASDSIFSQ